MKIWLDFLTPKQVYFLGELNDRLEKRGHEVFRTTRRYRETNEALEQRRISALVIGKHGGPSLKDKLTASANRTAKLAEIVDKIRPDLSVAFASPEAARTAFGLGIPHYTVNDSPHSTAVALLTVPLSKRLFTPKIIPLRAWTSLGARRDKIIQYDALDPVAWLRGFHPNPNILRKLGLIETKPIIVFRVEESLASYLVGKVPSDESILTPIIEKLLQRLGGTAQVVVLPRYKEQVYALKKRFSRKIFVPSKVVDGCSLLSRAALFVGAGGTMTAEASLLGIPTISCYPAQPTLVESFLIRKGLVSRLTRTEAVIEKICKILDEPTKCRRLFKEKARDIFSKMEDPIDVMVKTISRDFPKHCLS